MKISVIAIYIWLLLQLNLSRSNDLEDYEDILEKYGPGIAYVHGVESHTIHYWVSAVITPNAVLAGFVSKKCEKICRVVVGAKTWEQEEISRLPIKRAINLNEEDYIPPQLSIVQFQETLVFNRTVAPVPLPSKRFYKGQICLLFTWGEYRDLTESYGSNKLLKVFEVQILRECGEGTFCFKLKNDKDDLDFCEVRSGPILCNGVLTGLVYFAGSENCKDKLRATSVYDFINWVKVHIGSLQYFSEYARAEYIKQGSSSGKISPNEMFIFYMIYSIICLFFKCK